MPSASAIGVSAPVLLVVLRILQGLSAGGEWGGAALLAVEHAPVGRRGLYGSFPQIGVPIGLLLANGVLAAVAAATIAEALQTSTGSVYSVGVYLAGMTIVGIVASLFIRHSPGRDLSASGAPRERAARPS